MKKSTALVRGRSQHWMPALFWLTGAAALVGVIALTTLPGRVRVINAVHNILDHIFWGDMIGHFALFAALTFVLFWMLRRAARLRVSLALWLTVFTGVMIGGITEYLQQYSPGRAVDRADLMANWLGVFAAATVIMYAVLLVRLRKL